MKTYYLPVMVVKDVRKGYSIVNDEDEVWGYVAYVVFSKARKKFLTVFRGSEKVANIVTLHYPVVNVCLNDKCYLVNPESGRQIEDYGVVGTFAILSSFSSTTPYLSLSSNVDFELNVGSDSFNDEYSMPLLKTGEGVYYVPYIYVEYVDKRLREEILPPIYYVPPTQSVSTKLDLREFSELLRLIKGSEAFHRRIDELKKLKHRFLLEYVERMKKGLTILVDKKLIPWSVATYINYILP